MSQGRSPLCKACQCANLFKTQLLLLATLQVDYLEAGELVGDHFDGCSTTKLTKRVGASEKLTWLTILAREICARPPHWRHSEKYDPSAARAGGGRVCTGTATPSSTLSRGFLNPAAGKAASPLAAGPAAGSNFHPGKDPGRF